MSSSSSIVRGFGFALAVAVTGALTFSAHADDLNIPDYYGDDLSLYVHWQNERASFDGQDGWHLTGHNAFPDGQHELLAPLTESTVETVDDGLLFWTPNFVDELPEKWMRIQLTWIGDEQPTVSEIWGFDHGSGSETISEFIERVDGTPTDRLAESYAYEDWILRPNPDFEFVFINVPEGTFLRQVVIDSISIPEPGSLAMLGASAGLLLLRRRQV